MMEFLVYFISSKVKTIPNLILDERSNAVESAISCEDINSPCILRKPNKNHLKVLKLECNTYALQLMQSLRTREDIHVHGFWRGKFTGAFIITIVNEDSSVLEGLGLVVISNRLNCRIEVRG